MYIYVYVISHDEDDSNGEDNDKLFSIMIQSVNQFNFIQLIIRSINLCDSFVLNSNLSFFFSLLLFITCYLFFVYLLICNGH